jgi:predicted GNAT family acetyltransferase
MDSQKLTVIHNETAQRFEIKSEDHLAVLDYRLNGKTILFLHTGVPSVLEGRGLGGKLAKAGLDYARANQLRVQSLCWFVTGYIERHPEYQDLRG